MFALVLALAVGFLVVVIILGSLYGNGDREIAPVDRFPTDDLQFNGSQMPVIVPPTSSIEAENDSHEGEENENTNANANANEDDDDNHNDTDNDKDNDKEDEIYPPRARRTVRDRVTNARDIRISKNNTSFPTVVAAYEPVAFVVDEREIELAAYKFHREKQQAFLSGNSQHAANAAEVDFRAKLWSTLKASIDDAATRNERTSAAPDNEELTNAFDFYVERYCEVLSRSPRFESSLFPNSVPWLTEAISSLSVTGEQSLEIAELLADLKSVAPRENLSQEFLFLKRLKRFLLEDTKLLFPIAVQAKLNKEYSTMRAVWLTAAKQTFDQSFVEGILPISKDRHRLLLQLTYLLQSTLLHREVLGV